MGIRSLSIPISIRKQLLQSMDTPNNFSFFYDFITQEKSAIKVQPKLVFLGV